MYNLELTDKQLWEVGKTLGTKLVRYDDTILEEMLEKLENAVESRDKWGFATKVRTLTPPERAFIKNERLVCKYDFNYYFTRYCQTLIKLEGQPVVVKRIGKPLESQSMFLEYLSRKEQGIQEAINNKWPLDGYLVLCCKARQEGYTTISRALTTHRVFFWEDARAMGASIDETGVQELYDRDHEIYDHLPWWLKPSVDYDEKNKHFTFGKLGSKILYAQGSMKGGMGMGKTIPINHITELGNWDITRGAGAVANPMTIMIDLEPTWPQSADTLVIMESTSNGRGNFWHNLVENSLRGDTRFDVHFCPWYAEPRHNRKRPPENWSPSERTKLMMATVERTSPGYLWGKTVHIAPEQAYWWEANYEEKKKMQATAVFFTNYPTTIAESFQSSGNRAFSVETIDALRSGIVGGIPYKFQNTQPVGRIQ